MIRLLTVATWLTMMGVVAIPSVGCGEADDPKERDTLVRALPQAQVPLARGLSASAREGVPPSAKFEIDGGVFQLSTSRWTTSDSTETTTLRTRFRRWRSRRWRSRCSTRRILNRTRRRKPSTSEPVEDVRL